MIKKRLTQFLKHLGIGQEKFAKKVGLSKGYVNNIKDNITLNTVNKILQIYPQLNENWLLTGEGEMLKENYCIDLRPESKKTDGKNEKLLEQFNHEISEIIAIGKANAEVSRMNAESFNKVADSHSALTNSHGALINTHDTLTNSHDKLIDILKEYLSAKSS